MFTVIAFYGFIMFICGMAFSEASSMLIKQQLERDEKEARNLLFNR